MSSSSISSFASVHRRGPSSSLSNQGSDTPRYLESIYILYGNVHVTACTNNSLKWYSKTVSRKCNHIIQDSDNFQLWIRALWMVIVRSIHLRIRNKNCFLQYCRMPFSSRNINLLAVSWILNYDYSLFF